MRSSEKRMKLLVFVQALSLFCARILRVRDADGWPRLSPQLAANRTRRPGNNAAQRAGRLSANNRVTKVAV
jgi:hypothetical protein